MCCSTGDWSFHLWRVGTTAPIFTARSAPDKYTAAAWSPTREGVLFLGLADGSLQCWDLLDRSHEPSLSASVRPRPCSAARMPMLMPSSAIGVTTPW